MQSNLRVFGKFEDAKNSQYSDEDERAALLRRLAVASYVLQPTHRAATRRAASAAQNAQRKRERHFTVESILASSTVQCLGRLGSYVLQPTHHSPDSAFKCHVAPPVPHLRPWLITCIPVPGMQVISQGRRN